MSGQSAGAVLLAAVLAALQDKDLRPFTMFDAAPVRAGLPYGVVEEPVLRAEDATGVTGRVGTLAISFHDGGERPVALRAAAARADALIALLPTTVGGGWRIAGMSLARSRLQRTKDGWTARSEWAVRMFRAVG